jgi:hypothetical protein
MVERSHTAGWLPQMYEPLRKLRERVADWFAPKADGTSNMPNDCKPLALKRVVSKTNCDILSRARSEVWTPPG